MLNSSDWTALTLTFELALISTIIILVIGTPIAWWLSQTKVRFKFLIDQHLDDKPFSIISHSYGCILSARLLDIFTNVEHF